MVKLKTNVSETSFVSIIRISMKSDHKLLIPMKCWFFKPSQEVSECLGRFWYKDQMLRRELTVFCDVMPCSLAEVYWCFQRNVLPPSSGSQNEMSRQAANRQLCGITSQKIVLPIVTAMRTSNLI
jgi:hypothetical protein